MALGVGLFEVLDGQLAVMFERFQVFVPQDLLDVIEVGPTPDQLSSTRKRPRVLPGWRRM